MPPVPEIHFQALEWAATERDPDDTVGRASRGTEPQFAPGTRHDSARWRSQVPKTQLILTIQTATPGKIPDADHGSLPLQPDPTGY